MKPKSSFRAGTGPFGCTEPGQYVTAENMSHLPAGSVVRNGDGSRLIHLHDGLWLWCCDAVCIYDQMENLTNRLDEKSVACHVAPEAPRRTKRKTLWNTVIRQAANALGW